MDRPPVISGIGLISPLGRDVNETWHALLAGEFIRDHARVKLDQPETRIHQLALSAAREAVADARWTTEILKDESTALVIGTSKGPVECWLAGKPTLAFGLADLAAHLAYELKLGLGPRTTLSAACASGLHALIHATLLLKTGAASRAIVVAAEASVHPLFIGSFKRLGVLAPEGTDAARSMSIGRAS